MPVVAAPAHSDRTLQPSEADARVAGLVWRQLTDGRACCWTRLEADVVTVVDAEALERHLERFERLGLLEVARDRGITWIRPAVR